jgi:hypothetical protein
LVGHVTWQGPPPQPNAAQQIPISLTLRINATGIAYATQNTDNQGFFTVSVSSLITGTYGWWVKAPRYLASAGQVTLTGAQVTNVEMGLMLVGDANDDNVVSSIDFSILRGTWNKVLGDPGFDPRADFTRDNVISALDFSLLRNNYNHAGAPPLGPVP